MKKKPKSLLSQPEEDYPDENWLFLFDKECARIIDNKWQSEALFYELSRELEPDRPGPWNPRAYFEEISEGHFPEAPFLKLDDADQEELVGRMRKDGSLFQTHVQLLETCSIFESQIERSLTDEIADHLENVAREAAEMEASKWDGLTLSDFLPLTNPGERAVATERNRLLAEGAKIFEPSQCTVTLHLDLEFPDTAIKGEFARLLERIRTTKPSPDRDRRGRVKKAGLPFQRLAAYRLKRKHGSFDSVGGVLLKKRHGDSPISSESGWNKAANAGKEMVEKFKDQWQKAASDGDQESTDIAAKPD